MERIDASLVHQRLEPRAADGERRPALLMLHGRGADEHDLLPLSASLDERLVILSARAPFRLGPGYHWYELIDIGVPEPRTFARALRLLQEFIDQIIEPYRIDPERLYLLGFSQGGMMSGALTLTRPGRVAGTVVLSGYLPLHAGLTIDAAGLRGKPFFVGHGAADPVIPVSFGRESRDFLTQAGADLTYREYPMGHQISGDELADVAAWLGARIERAAGGDERAGGQRG